MADNAVAITAGTGTNIDTRTEATNGNHRQVVVLGDPSVNAGVAPVDATAGLKVDLGADNDITGTVTANLSATDNAVLDSIDTKLTDVATQTTLAAIKSKTDNIPALGQALAAASTPVVLTAAQITTLTPPTPQTDALTDTQLRATPVPVSGTFYQATQPVSLASVPSHAVTNVGTFAVQATLAAETTKVIGTVNVAASQSIQLAAGTNGIGKLTANSGVDIGDVDVTSLPALAAGTNAVGKLLPPDIDVTAHTNYARKYYTSAGAATDGIVWSPAAGKRWHVTSLYFQVSADCTVTFEDDKVAGDDPVLKGEYKAGSGLSLSFDEKYPFASGEDAADLLVTTTAGNIYITVVGYEI